MNAQAPEQASEQVCQPYPWWRVVLAPGICIFSPRRAAAYMTGGPRFAWLAAFALGAVCLAAVFVFLLMWEATIERELGSRLATTQASPIGVSVHEFSFAEVWHRWHREGTDFGKAELTVLVVLLVLPVVAGFAAWLFLPVIHSGGSVLTSFRRSFQVVASGVGLLAVLTLVAGSPVIYTVNAEKLNRFNPDVQISLAALTIMGSQPPPATIAPWRGSTTKCAWPAR